MATGLSFKYDLSGNMTGVDLPFIITGSATITKGDVVTLTSGYVALATASLKPIGVVVGFVDNDGQVLDSPYADYDGTYTPGGVGVGTYVAASDNTTDKKIKAIVRVSRTAVYSAPLDATIGTTTGSNLPGYYIDAHADSDKLGENSASATTGVFMTLGVDPDNSANALVIQAQSKFDAAVAI
jgi:hypothetical protein